MKLSAEKIKLYYILEVRRKANISWILLSISKIGQKMRGEEKRKKELNFIGATNK